MQTAKSQNRLLKNQNAKVALSRRAMKWQKKTLLNSQKVKTANIQIEKK